MMAENSDKNVFPQAGWRVVSPLFLPLSTLISPIAPTSIMDQSANAQLWTAEKVFVKLVLSQYSDNKTEKQSRKQEYHVYCIYPENVFSCTKLPRPNGPFPPPYIAVISPGNDSTRRGQNISFCLPSFSLDFLQTCGGVWWY